MTISKLLIMILTFVSFQSITGAAEVSNPLEINGVISPSGDPYEKFEDRADPFVKKWVEAQNDRTLSIFGPNRYFQKFLQEKQVRARRLLSKSKFQNVILKYDGVFRWKLDYPSFDHGGVLKIEHPYSGNSGKKKWQPVLDLQEFSESQGADYNVLEVNCNPNLSHLCLLVLAPNYMDATVLRLIDLKSNKISKDLLNGSHRDVIFWLSENEFYLSGILKSSNRLTQKYLLRKKDGEYEIQSNWNFPQTDKRIVSFFNGGRKTLAVPRWNDGHFCYDFIGDINLKEKCLPSGYRFVTLLRNRIVAQYYEEDGYYPENAIVEFEYSENSDIGNWSSQKPLFSPGPNQRILEFKSTLNGLVVAYGETGEGYEVKYKRFAFSEGGSFDSLGELLPPTKDLYWRLETSVLTDEVYWYTHGSQPFWALAKGSLFSNEYEIVEQLAAEDLDVPNVVKKVYVATSPSGIAIPYSVYALRTNFKGPTPKPTIVNIYGGHYTTISDFRALSSVNYRWIYDGGIVVVPHVRGSSYWGSAWSEAAKGKTKQNTYDDAVAVINDLIHKNLAISSQVGIIGGSSGGLASAVIAMQNHQLVKAAVVEVALLDLKRMEGPLGAWAFWNETYGYAKVDFDNMVKRSPYHMIEKGMNLPSLLVTSASFDDRVHPGHSRKFVAKLNDYVGSKNVFYYESPRGSHNGESMPGIFKSNSLVYSFLKSQLWPE